MATIFSSDIDECLSQEHYSCLSKTGCENTVGSYRCSCIPGYSGDGKVCTDVDECGTSAHNCSDHAHCNNTIGSYHCRCVEGFQGNGMSCKDVDECKLANMHNCSVRAHGINTIGSYNCTCHEGFHGDGHSCLDVDEFKGNIHNCSVHALCHNTIGSFNCTCPKGFLGDGHSCQRISFGLKICTLGNFLGVKRPVSYCFRYFFGSIFKRIFFVISGSEKHRYSLKPFFSNHNVDERSMLIVSQTERKMKRH